MVLQSIDFIVLLIQQERSKMKLSRNKRRDKVANRRGAGKETTTNYVAHIYSFCIHYFDIKFHYTLSDWHTWHFMLGFVFKS